MQNVQDIFITYTGYTWAFIKKHYVVSGIVAVLLVYVIWKICTGTNTSVVTAPVVSGTLRQTVLATGTVTSVTDLNLAFKASHTVHSVNVVVGDVVHKGDVLATLDNGSELGSLTQAQAAVKSAQANYQKTQEGATDEEVAVAQVALANAQLELQHTITTQNTLVENARRTMLSSGLVALSTTQNTSTTGTPTILGTYSGDAGTYTINVYTTGNGGYFSFSGLESGSNAINTSIPVLLGTKGLFIQFPTNFSYANATNWTVTIPNTQSTTYVANYNAYQSALDTQKSATQLAQSAVDTAAAQLDLKKAKARPSDLDAADASVLSAQGQLQSAEASYENTIIRAPSDGTITHVDTKIGELATALTPVITLQDVSNLYVDANVNESNISHVAVGQDVLLTFDALPHDQIYKAKITSVDPGATINSGIVNYEVKAALVDQAPIKPGMTANMTIIISSKDNVLAVPQKALVTRDGATYIDIITNTKKGTSREQQVTTGVSGDGNLVEIVSGISATDQVVIHTTQ